MPETKVYMSGYTDDAVILHGGARRGCELPVETLHEAHARGTEVLAHR
jgi:hypothetical protein